MSLLQKCISAAFHHRYNLRETRSGFQYKLSQSHPNIPFGQKDSSDKPADAEADSARLNGSPGCGHGTPATPSPPCNMAAVKAALRSSADEFELHFTQEFVDLFSSLPLTAASFGSVMDEVFADGINWGRVVGLFAFGGALCVECVEKDMCHLVAQVVDWMTSYLDRYIQPWVQSQGGWDRFAELYGRNASAEARRFREGLRKWLLVGAGVLTLLLGTMAVKNCR